MGTMTNERKRERNRLAGKTMMLRGGCAGRTSLCCFVTIVGLLLVVATTGFQTRPIGCSVLNHAHCQSRWVVHATSNGIDGEGEEAQNDPVLGDSVIRIDDGGSDLTDRFKYKVRYRPVVCLVVCLSSPLSMDGCWIGPVRARSARDQMIKLVC